MKYVCLLRGINVGGKNLIKMAELKILLEKLGFSSVKTYIASGNVIFESNLDKLAAKAVIEKRLLERISSPISVLLLTAEEMRRIVSERPAGFGEDRAYYKYDVAFLIDPLTVDEAFSEFTPRVGVDRVWAGELCVYIAMDLKQLTKSWISKIIESPIYPFISIRNWNTTWKLSQLIDDTK